MKKSKQKYPFTEEGILKLFRENVKGSIRKRDIYKIFSQRVEGILQKLISTGKLMPVKSKSLTLTENSEVVIGRFDAKRGGYGFIIPENGQPDIFIPPTSTYTALNGDRVSAVIINRKRREGKIIKVLKRERDTYTGILRKESGISVVDVSEEKIRVPFVVKNNKGIKVGSPVLIRLKKWVSQDYYPEADIIEKIDITRMGSQYIVKELGIREHYSPSAKEEIPKIINKALSNNRVSLKDERTFTIDPDDAKDFDDAVSIKSHSDGYELSVHISDVSYWIDKGSETDKEALERGCTVYLPDRVINMFPPEIVGNVMSLIRGVEKPTMTVKMWLSKEGLLKRYEIFESIIVNKNRMTYKEAQKIIENGEGEFAADLRAMDKLSRILHNKRKKRGSLDFDLPEIKIKFNEDGEVDIPEIQERLPTHHLIEEFMVLANEVVAAYIFSSGYPGIYRAHESPDITKIENFFRFSFSLGFNSHNGKSIKDIQEVLDEARGTIYERVVNYALLRSMKRARYVAFQSKHYGLAAEFYTHFTSPIRRYPDLITQRILRSILHKRKLIYSQEELLKISDLSTEGEWRSDEAERSSVELYILLYLKKHRDREYEGIITDAFPAGLQIELIDFIVSGNIKIQELPPDDYRYREKLFSLKGKYHRFKLGDRIMVGIKSVDIITRQLEFEYIGMIKHNMGYGG